MSYVVIDNAISISMSVKEYRKNTGAEIDFDHLEIKTVSKCERTGDVGKDTISLYFDPQHSARLSRSVAAFNAIMSEPDAEKQVEEAAE